VRSDVRLEKSDLVSLGKLTQITRPQSGPARDWQSRVIYFVESTVLLAGVVAATCSNTTVGNSGLYVTLNRYLGITTSIHRLFGRGRPLWFSACQRE
jgi:hypothetical protein